MVRNILGVVAGYLAMFLFIMITFFSALPLFGVDRVFQPGSFDLTMLWIVVSILLSVAAALLGGYVCAAISRNRKAAMALAGLVFLLGLVMAVSTLSAERSSAIRPAGMSVVEAMDKVHEPVWLAILNPVIGAVGTIAGAGLRKQSALARS